MTRKELNAVRKELRFVHSAWHMCGLSAKDAKASNLKPGRLCDTCESDIEAAIGRIKTLGSNNA